MKGQMMEQLWIFCLIPFLLGCQAGFVDNTEAIRSQPILTYLEGENGAPVSLEENLIALMHRPEGSKRWWDTRILITNQSTEEWQLLPLPPLPETCSTTAPVGVGNLTRLPDGNLGFILICDLKTRGVKSALYQWDKETNSIEMLYEYEPYFRANRFTFSPDRVTVIQATGSGTRDQMFRLTLDEEMEPFVPEFLRANHPTWSPDGKTIAFIGTETFPGGDPNEFTTYEETRDLLFYPWDIYLLNEDGSNKQQVLSGIVDPWELHWLPNNNRFLSFSGNYKDKPGIWMLDIATGKVTRIWPERTSYSWSPDGQQMIIESQEENREDHGLVIVDLPTNEID